MKTFVWVGVVMSFAIMGPTVGVPALTFVLGFEFAAWWVYDLVRDALSKRGFDVPRLLPRKVDELFDGRPPEKGDTP